MCYSLIPPLRGAFRLIAAVFRLRLRKALADRRLFAGLRIFPPQLRSQLLELLAIGASSGPGCLQAGTMYLLGNIVPSDTMTRQRGQGNAPRPLRVVSLVPVLPAVF